jgi:hypothetical protein
MSESKSLYPGWQVVQWTPPAHTDNGVGIIKRYVGSPYPTKALAEAKMKAISMFSVFPAFKNHFTVIELNVPENVYQSWVRKGMVTKPEPVLPTLEPINQGAQTRGELKCHLEKETKNML